MKEFFDSEYGAFSNACICCFTVLRVRIVECIMVLYSVLLFLSLKNNYILYKSVS